MKSENKMEPEKIWLSPPHLGLEELKQVQEAFKLNWIAPVGPHIDQFEKDICQLTGAKHSVALSSGTAAIHLALVLMGIERGDEVLVSTLTFAASVFPILYQGAIPLMVDSEASTANISPFHLEEAIKNRLSVGKKPKAIIVVHLYGMPAQMDKILDISHKYDIPIIEDAAEALGSCYKGQALGTFGLFGIYSFNGNKIITTSGGGSLISNNETLINKARVLSTQARDPAPHYQHSQVGYNYRMSNICAAIGIGQLKVLSERVTQRRENFETYKEKLGANKFIEFISEPDASYYSNHWITWVKIVAGHQSVTPDVIRNSLGVMNIEARPLWKPMHLQPIFNNCLYFGEDVAELLFKNSLCLPSGSNLTESQLTQITKIVMDCFAEH